jgi:acetyl esterase/lipase
LQTGSPPGGVTAFLLKYRVGPKARLPIPLSDGRRAIRFVRAHAATFDVDPARIGMIGFSAGGHLSAFTAATAEPGRADAADPVDRVSSRPDFLVLGYPWLEGTVVDPRGRSQYCTFARVDCRPQDFERFVPVKFVTKEMPPTFIYHTSTDGLVPVEGSLRFYEALRTLKVPVEMHLFAAGNHGTGLGGSDAALAEWPELLENWLRAQQLLTKPGKGAR